MQQQDQLEVQEHIQHLEEHIQHLEEHIQHLEEHIQHLEEHIRHLEEHIRHLEEHIRHMEEHIQHLEELPVLDTLVHLEADTLVRLGQATQLQDLVIQLQGQATQDTLSQATQHSLEAILLSLSIRLLQAAILLVDQEVILLLLGPILLLQELIPLLLEVTHPNLALHIPLSDIVHVIAVRCDSEVGQ